MQALSIYTGHMGAESYSIYSQNTDPIGGVAPLSEVMPV